MKSVKVLWFISLIVISRSLIMIYFSFSFWYCCVDVCPTRKLLVTGDNVGNTTLLSMDGQKVKYYTNMPCQCGYPEWTILPRGDIPSGYPHWHDIFVLLYRTNPNLAKYQWKQQWLPVDPVRTVDVLPVDISLVDMMEWPTVVSQSPFTIFTWGIIKHVVSLISSVGQGLETGCQKLAIVKFLDVLFSRKTTIY